MKKISKISLHKISDTVKQPTEEATRSPAPSTRSEHTATDATVEHHEDDNPPSQGVKRDWRFWAIFVALATVVFLSSLEGSIVSTALPAITRAINAGENYVWIVNVYLLTR